MKKLFSVFLCAVLLIGLSVIPINAEDLSISAAAYELYCPDNGQVILSDYADSKLPMASTTKIMTTLITLEHAAKDNTAVEFTEEMTAEGSSMYLKIGEKVTLYDLAVGMMMQSGNDAANAAAIAIAGSTDAFADLMNEKAREIGMTNTHFVTPSGLDDEQHYSTAHDMALLMAQALKNKAFAEITAQTSMTVDFISPSNKHVTYPNHNRLLKLYDGCIGGKTGYTDTAGRCLVTAAERDGMTLIAVTLDDRNDWNDHTALYDYGFNHLNAVQPSADIPDSLCVVGGISDTVSVTVIDDSPLIVPAEQSNSVQSTLILPTFVYAPIQKNDTAGVIIFTIDGEAIGERSLVFTESVSFNNSKRDFITYIKDLFNWHS